MEPITTTVIVTLAFTKFLETTVEKFTEGGLEKIEELRQKIWSRLRGNAKTEEAFKAVEAQKTKDITPIVNYLNDLEDPKFLEELQTLARQIINIGTVEGENWNVSGGVVNYIKESKAPNIQGDKNTINISYNNPPS
ncbi:hypothetical protein [Crocosphaera sp.]|uniref:hypothetical protein n=1 Tax=Crocosphaera sp. TaxID=2729996 RepID=UPI00261C22B2|nr:hypothetical protein [Crocosphaera sp.]MDJ0578673.1 hypothetical protein [Crocosphaera sp.]